ncbi:sialin [Trichonephila inaurata madagascariensis]|uniref:Sialin n=1 Tax=Trichonephila inaurata madagascariensis TaxID=2747483 RepID=A0A8X6XCQ3_9ARAC|nr:sialin [Trichonephila inaurata madagascariensis]
MPCKYFLSKLERAPYFSVVKGLYSSRSMAQWRYVYYGTIVVVLVTTLVYVVCGTSDPQEWGTYDEEPIEEETVDLTKKEKPEDQP